MELVKRAFGYIHIILALVVAAQILTSDIYDSDAADDVWNVLNYFIAIGVVAALVFSYLRSREADRSDMSEWIASNVMLIASSALFLLFFEQWFTVDVFKDAGYEPGEYRSIIWIMINVTFPIVNMIVGSYLLRSARSG